jgi:hypothetical protein
MKRKLREEQAGHPGSSKKAFKKKIKKDLENRKD